MALTELEIATLAKFTVELYGKFEKISQMLSKGRVRIFYKGLNRNGSYINDEFAQKLIDSLPGAPVSGIYDGVREDFTNHGIPGKNGLDVTHGQPYGFVSENPNIQWEDHLDSDGVTRSYCCADVILWTTLYEEANKIIGKAQSMELWPPSISGHFAVHDGIKCFEFETGVFAGLRVLGDDRTPCYQGSAFFTLYNEFLEMKKELENISQFIKKDNEGGATSMDIHFKGPNAPVLEQIWYTLNPNFKENGEVAFVFSKVTDNSIIGCDLDGNVEKTYTFTKAEDGTITLGEVLDITVVTFSIDEFAALNSLYEANENSLVKVASNFTQLNEQMTTLQSTFDADKAAFEAAKATLEASVASLNEKNSALETEKTGLHDTISTLEEEKRKLSQCQLEATQIVRTSLFEKYKSSLIEEDASKFEGKMMEYTSDEDFEKDMVFAISRSNPALFSLAPNTAVIPTEDNAPVGLEKYLSDYQKMRKNNGGRA